MTKQEFINEFNLNEKLENIEILKKMNFKDWFFNIEQERIKNRLEKYQDIDSALNFNKLEELYFIKNYNNLSKQEKEEVDFLLHLFKENKEYQIEHIEKEIKKFYIDLEYFCEIPNLPFEEWLNTYYVRNLAHIPEEEFPLKYKKERLLRVDVFNGKLNEEDYYEIMKHDPIEAYQSKIYIKSDYTTYLKTQITNPTIEMQYFYK